MNRAEYKTKGRKLRDERNEKERQYDKIHGTNYAKQRTHYRNIKSKYNLSTKEYADMLAKQEGICAICGNPEIEERAGEVKALSIDHCHETKIIRGLLCRKCNSGLGMFKDNPETLEKAAQYVRIHQKRAKIKLIG